ncbi:MAG: DEAD/DEAH box helicase [Alphaproteobacteria bacterium]|nr:DEAD/DEAH box helicase [Alphaproteobacteria bacterium]
MELSDLQEWILSKDGCKEEIEELARLLAIQDFPTLENKNDKITDDFEWKRLLLAASILTKSEKREALEAALTIAQAGFIISGFTNVADSSLLILNQLSNYRTLQSAIDKGYVKKKFEERLGINARLELFSRAMDKKIFLTGDAPINANKFQSDFWNSIENTDWLYASAPTASGKTYIVFRYLLEKLAAKKARLILYIAPTRALVTEVENEIRNMAAAIGIDNLSVSSIPIKELYKPDTQSVLVFTQERLHIFLNALENIAQVDILIVDEAQKLSDGMRGVILQDAIERVIRISPNTKVIYLSPNSENPTDLIQDAPALTRTKVVDNEQPMVSQNIIWASQTDEGSTNWKLEIKNKDDTSLLGTFTLKDRPTGIAKKMALVTAALGKEGQGYLVYANEAGEAERIASFISELVGEKENEDLQALSNLAKEGVHKDYDLVRTAKCGVAFHYGNMPSLLREEIEEAFNKGHIKFLVCTSTLIEGVNLSCKTIFIQGPRKGRTNQMEGQDFWNLAGRAGRWGKEFQGNIVCVEPDVWRTKPPERTKFKIKRQTEETLRKKDDFLAYLNQRNFETKTTDKKGSLESVLAYLMTIYKREGTITKQQWSKRFDDSYLEKIDEHLFSYSKDIDIPLAVIEKHSGISALSMQTLLNYFRSSYASGKKPLQKLIPLTPESTGAYENMEGLLNRINLKLYPAFGVGYQHKHYSILILNWMQGYTLKRLIENSISYHLEKSKKEEKEPKNVSTIIRDTMKEVEEIARFKAPKYISCYIDILKIFLKEQNKLDLYPKDYPFDLFLEFGVMSKTMLSLVGLGLSRMSATEIGKEILSSEYDKKQCFDWIKENIEKKEIPSFVKREIRKKFAL